MALALRMKVQWFVPEAHNLLLVPGYGILMKLF